MRTMLMQACALVADGVTTVEDVLRNVYAPGMDAEVETTDTGAPFVSVVPDAREVEPAVYEVSA